MALIDADYLRTNFPFIIHQDINDGQMEMSLASASERLEKWIGLTVYEETEALDDTERQRLILNNAEGHLALHYALLALNTNLRIQGLVKSEQVEGDTVNTYFTPIETANFTNQYLEMAREIAESYIGDGTPPAPEIVLADDDG